MALGYSASRLSYLRESYTRGEIQSKTGIHWKTQEAVLANTKTLSATQRQSLTSFYGKSTYSDFRFQGLSVKNATRFRGYTPATVKRVALEFENFLGRVSEHLIRVKYYDESESVIKRKLLEEQGGIIESYRIHSRKTHIVYEEWETHYM